jgi:SAM-dependent methyltransferase
MTHITRGRSPNGERSLIGKTRSLGAKIWHRAADAVVDRYFNVSTGGFVSNEELGTDAREAVHYAAMPYLGVFRALDAIPLPAAESALLDYGCGKGRVVVAAASRPYRQVIGVELTELSRTAEKNLAKMAHRIATNVTITQCDAGAFVVPDDINVIYFYNPFRGSVLQRVIEQIRASHRRLPRAIHVVYFNCDHFDRAIADESWIRKTHHSMVYPNTSFALYETIV